MGIMHQILWAMNALLHTKVLLPGTRCHQPSEMLSDSGLSSLHGIKAFCCLDFHIFLYFHIVCIRARARVCACVRVCVCE